MNKTILVIDDDMTVTEIVHIYFKTKGYEVHVAHDGMEGILRCRDLQPLIILLDLKMPKMNGDEALPFLREAAPAAFILLWSGLPPEILRRQTQGMMIDAFVEKPSSILELCNSVRHILVSREQPDSGASENPVNETAAKTECCEPGV